MIKKIIALLFLASCAYCAQVNSLQDSPVFVCHFNEGTGATIEATTGTITTFTTNGAWVDGQFGKAIYHNGATSSDGGNYQHIQDNLLINVWIKMDTGASYAKIARYYSPRAGYRVGWVITPQTSGNLISYDVNVASYGSTNSSQRQTPYKYKLNKWNLVSFWFKGTASGGIGRPHIYVNNEFTSVYPYDNNINAPICGTYNYTERITVGYFKFNGGDYYSDFTSFDDLSVYGNITTQTQAEAIIEQIWTQGRGQND